jgi:hypothetical protein
LPKSISKDEGRAAEREGGKEAVSKDKAKRLPILTLFLLLSTVPASAQAVSFPSRMVWQCGNVTVTWSMKDVPEHLTERPRSWFEYQVKGLEKRDNRFAADDDGLYMNGKLCWPVEPVTCLKPNGETEPCESRQIPLPKSRPPDAPPAVPIPKTVIYHDPGGYLHILEDRWRKLFESGDDVEIRGPCYSGCTMIMAYIPRERICFDRNASLNFHLPQADNRESALTGGRYMFNKYPDDIRLWLHERGGLEAMPHKQGWWVLWANDLWAMGYQTCEEEVLEPMTIISSGKRSSG